MAGETEDCINFQADHLPTGSISFGRFELECLSWERRSSFSHNRYLEEVEKYSTPGSVTQKRAILEAHFKKKPLLPPPSPENQDEGEYHGSRNHIDQQTSSFEELEVRDNEGPPEFAWYDDTPDVSDENEILEGNQEEENSQLECKSYGEEKVLHPSELSDLDHTLQPQEDLLKPSNKDILCEVIESEPDNKAVIVEELLEKRGEIIVEVHENRGMAPRSSMVERNNVHSLNRTLKASLKVNEAIKQTTAKIRTQLPVQQQNLRKSPIKRSSDISVDSKSVEKAKRENTLRTKSVKQLPSRATSTSSNSKNLKLEPSQSLTAKVRKEERSIKDVQTKKVGTTDHAISGKSEKDIRQTANRPKEIADSAKEEVKQSGVVFSFKCEERAERRKEYYTKLEEKLHAKEAERNEIQAKTQEETEARLKQLRRSLNFKATPMPSFYHEAVPKVSEEKEKLVNPTKPQKPQIKSASPVTRSNREKNPVVSKSANRQNPENEPNRTTESTQKIEAGKKDERSRPTTQQQQRESVTKKADSINRINRRNGARTKSGMGGGSVAVHVAS